MNEDLRQHVARRAGWRCEYCHLAVPFDDLPFCLEHIVARKHHGATSLENLAFACFWCNVYKGDNLAGIDPETGAMVRLFHPRHDAWSEHFGWEGAIAMGRTDIGRATIDVLNVNARLRVELRGLLLTEGIDFQ
jgi:hypothetical protein